MIEEDIAGLLPAKTPVYLDSGFQGIENIAPNLNIKKPKKKPRGRKLNGGEKLGNALISAERVKVEHAIGGIKRFKIVSDIYRGISRDMEKAFRIVCGLWNLKIKLGLETQSQ